MDENLISKKELLDTTGISYGQLYRWKRKKLIPEEWFIKKSAFTGQETFFPRSEILERIEKIKNMKDDASLDDLAQIFSPKLSDMCIKGKDLIEKHILMEDVIMLCNDKVNLEEAYEFYHILYIYIVEKCLIDGSISREEGKIVYNTMKDNYNKFAEKNCEMIFVRKMGIGITIVLEIPSQIHFEALAKEVIRLNINACIEELKLKLKEML